MICTYNSAGPASQTDAASPQHKVRAMCSFGGRARRYAISDTISAEAKNKFPVSTLNIDLRGRLSSALPQARPRQLGYSLPPMSCVREQQDARAHEGQDEQLRDGGRRPCELQQEPGERRR